MKATGLFILSILVILCFGLLWALDSPANSTPAPQLTANEDHQVDLATALQLIKNHKSSRAASAVKGGFFSRVAFEKILSQPGVIGIRYYYAQKNDGTPTLVLVGVDAKEQDMQSGLIMERSIDCPPWCSNSELSK
jgi:hypothetical protein